jgi:hypothetical protein
MPRRELKMKAVTVDFLIRMLNLKEKILCKGRKYLSREEMTRF